jgi:hypothetical protein
MIATVYTLENVLIGAGIGAALGASWAVFGYAISLLRRKG